MKKKGKEDLLEIARSVSEIANIHYIRQKEPRGLGHAILMAKHFIGNEPFAVLLGDDVIVSKQPCLQQMIDIYSEYRTSILGVQQVPEADVNKYGIVNGRFIEDRVYKVKDLVEKPSCEEAPSNVAILGRYIITPSIFKYLETQGEGAGGEIQLTDSLRRLVEEEAIYAYNFIGKRYDVGNIMGFLQATVEFALRRDELRDEFLTYLQQTVNQLDEVLKVD